MPQPEKDDAYDEIMAEINGLEKEFDQDLEIMKEKLK
jgi:hypothetical protein